MRVFDWYLFKNLGIATVFVSLTLSAIIFLTQSLRFLELVIESGASSTSFWILTFLALPRFFEIIVPLAIMAATVFIYNRMNLDSELVAVRAIGYSPLSIARPAIILAALVTIFLWGMTLWAAPKSLAGMHQMRQVIKAQFSSFLFKEGVFNQFGSGLTVYIHARNPEGEMSGLMIHDNRKSSENPATILAKRGVLVAREEDQQVVVYDGIRQERNKKTGALNRLNFERYTIDLPESDPVRKRWREPDERTAFELLNPNLNVKRDLDNLRNFKVELHRRIAGPLLAFVFTLVACASLLIGPVDRRGQGVRITIAIGSVVLLQSLFLASFNLARQSDWGLPVMYVLILLPLALCVFLLTGASETFRRQFLYTKEPDS